jgi:hypothetical protein
MHKKIHTFGYAELLLRTFAYANIQRVEKPRVPHLPLNYSIVSNTCGAEWAPANT